MLFIEKLTLPALFTCAVKLAKCKFRDSAARCFASIHVANYPCSGVKLSGIALAEDETVAKFAHVFLDERMDE